MMVPKWVSAVVIVGVALTILIAVLQFRWQEVVIDEGEPGERHLYVTEAVMTYENLTSGGSSVTVHIGVENRGDVGQSLEGCTLRASVSYNGAPMDEEALTLDGRVDANDSASFRFDFQANIPIERGDEIRVWAVLEEEDGTVLDIHDFDFSFHGP